MIGQTISHYKILDKLGEGGMGVVYKAEDTRLDRTVALKFLPSHLLGSEEVRKRFEREAKAAAALSHPNICRVYELDQAQGHTFIAMEYVEGVSLDAKIAEGPLKIEAALDIAQQIAKGLEAAHKKGIFHRDIKPQNVMLGEDGHTTIMDFGLAQLAEASRLTKTDQTVGTIAYMSPEQAEGSGTDHRTDIWSLGVVLYEMIAGQAPFRGDYDQAILYSILNEQPEPLTAIRTGVPMELERAINKCLAKDRDERYQSCADLAVDLRGFAHTEQSRVNVSRATIPTFAAAQTDSAASKSGLPWKRYLVWGIVLSWLVYQNFSRTDDPPEVLYLSVNPPAGTMFPAMRGTGGRPELSPDGRRLAFRALSEDGSVNLWVRELSRPTAEMVPNTRGGGLPFWSPDGRALAFYADGKLKKVDLESGSVITLADAQGRGGTWGRDRETGEETIVFSAHNFAGLTAIPALGGESRPVTELDPSRGHESHRAPFFLPDGRRFLYVARTRNREEHFGIYLGSIDAGAEEDDLIPGPMLVRADAGVWYSPPAPGRGDGYLLYDFQDTLTAQRFNPERIELLGEPIPIIQPIESPGNYGMGSFSASANGLLVYRPAEGANTQPTWFDREGNPVGTIGEPGFYRDVALSPDGKKAALTVIAQDGDNYIGLYDVETGVGPTRLTFDEGANNSPIWSPDGRSIAYSVNRVGTFELYAKPSDGSGESAPLKGLSGVPTDWTALGRLLYSSSAPGTAWDVWGLDVDGGEETAHLQGPQNETSAQLSPDGLWIAFTEAPGGDDLRVVVRPFPIVNEGMWVVSANVPGSLPVWSSDGDELFYLSNGYPVSVVRVPVLDGETFRSGPPEPLFSFAPGDVSLDMGAKIFDVDRSGRKFLVLSAIEKPDQSYEVIVNWQASLP